MNKGTAYLIYKLILTTVIVAGLAVGGWILYQEFLSSDPHFEIDDTENVIEELSSIGEFTVATYYEEQVLKNSKLSTFAKSPLGRYLNSDSNDELVFIARGHVRAGFNLSRLDEDDVVVSGDSIKVRLAPAEIFDVIMNPSDFEVFVEEGRWSHEEVRSIQHEAKMELRQNALDSGILGKVKDIGVRKLSSFLKALGFSTVEVTVRETVNPKALFR